MGMSERGYRAMPHVEQTLASYLSPDVASSLKAPTLPTKPLRTSSALVGKGYAAAGQAGSCLHTMAVLQAYQTDLLKELDEGEGFSAEDIGELRKAADLSLRATKETARAIGRSMAALVAAERHLWLTLSDIKDRVFLLVAVGVVPERAQLIASGRSTKVVETILQPRAPSTRRLYALKWRLFTSWCGDSQLDPVKCPVGTVLEFLQARLSAGLTHSTLKVCVAASAYHASLGGQSVGRNPLVTHFLCGVLRLRPPVRSQIPPWDLAVMLDALYRPPFEPIEEISNRHLTLKTVFLLAVSSLKRVGDLQALSVAPTHLDFAPGMAKAFLYPHAGCIPKVPYVTPQPVVLQAFSPPPFLQKIKKGYL